MSAASHWARNSLAGVHALKKLRGGWRNSGAREVSEGNCEQAAL